VPVQNLRRLSVSVSPLEGPVAGTGVIVSPEGLVLTCAHVARAAGALSSERIVCAELLVRFPAVGGRAAVVCRARVARWFAEHDDDVVLLEMIDAPPLLRLEDVAVLASTAGSEGNTFRSYGYRPLGRYPASLADGQILGHVEAPDGKQLQCEPVQLRSEEIDQGMSGAAVLDLDRNLVVGLVAETWRADETQKNARTAWAADAKCAALPPLLLTLAGDAPAADAPDLPPSTRSLAPATGTDTAQDALHGTPSPLEEWTGRDDLLAELTADWQSPRLRITGLVGLGGEGKTSLVRQWLATLMAGPEAPRAVFWWAFYDRPNLDEFFEAALAFLEANAGSAVPEQDAGGRVERIETLLRHGRFLFVLDGLEVMQHESGDDYGLARSFEFRRFLSAMAGVGHDSHCVVTSRAALMDLVDHASYAHREVRGLETSDGVALLTRLGVTGSPEHLARVVDEWDGHPLSLSLLASYVVDHAGGRLDAVGADWLQPVADEGRYARIQRVLTRYDRQLSPLDRDVLQSCSVFRTPVALVDLRRALPDGTSREALVDVLRRLEQLRLIRHDDRTDRYRLHKLVAVYHYEVLKSDAARCRTLHARVSEVYLDAIEDLPPHPRLEDLTGRIEAVHHLARAEKITEALAVMFRTLFGEGTGDPLHQQLSADDTLVEMLSDFFPEGDFGRPPLQDRTVNTTIQLVGTEPSRFLVSSAALHLMNVGRVDESVALYEGLEGGDSNDSILLQNLAEAYFLRGRLRDAEACALRAVKIAERFDDEDEGRDALVDAAGYAIELGDVAAAGDRIARAGLAERDHIGGYANIHVRYLVLTGELREAAVRVTMNLRGCAANHWLVDLAEAHVRAAELVSLVEPARTREHLEAAVSLGRQVRRRRTVVEVLLARGRWAAAQARDDDDCRELAAADLAEALDYASASGWPVHEARARLGLARLNLAIGEHGQAARERDLARSLSEASEFHWGLVEADELDA
jgi:tetratricopeptide (TPR) repeat protein